jgi:hypothetical protein
VMMQSNAASRIALSRAAASYSSIGLGDRRRLQPPRRQGVRRLAHGGDPR